MFYFRNKIKSYILVVLTVFLGLGMPPVSSAKAEPVVPAISTFPEQPVRVVPAQSNEVVRVTYLKTSVPVCSIDAMFSIENLQAAISLNLNQPAQCFSVALRLPEIQSYLTVASPPTYALSLVNHSTGSVLRPGPKFTTAESKLQPMLPGYVVEYEDRKDLGITTLLYTLPSMRGSQYLLHTPSLSMLSVLRC